METTHSGAAGPETPLRFSGFSLGTMDILCRAEACTKGASVSLVGQRHLIEGRIENGGGLGGSLLIQNGVTTTRLLDK